MGTQPEVAFPLAVLAAATFALSAALQQRAARQEPEKVALSWRLIADLVRNRLWVAGMGCVLVGYVLQAAAFNFAPIAAVEPVVGIEIVFALPLAARLRHLRLGRREWLGAACVVGGVAAFLALSEPAGGNTAPGLVRWGLVAAPVAALVVAVALVGRARRDSKKAPLLAVSAGLSFGLLALFTQSLVHLISSHGVLGALESWQLYALAVTGPAAFTVAQSAYQAGPLAMSLPILDSIEPVSSVVVAALVFSQHVSVLPAHLAGELAGATLAVTGIFLLARSPLVLSVYRETEKERSVESDETGVCSGTSKALAG